MSTVCERTDANYSLLADIYYPITEQGAYGNVSKQWILDATIACFFYSGGRKNKQSVMVEQINIELEQVLIGRTRKDIRFNSNAAANSITNVILTNIRNGSNEQIYMETSGPRAGKSTLFEIASNEPVVNPFGKIEYYKVVIRRSANQAADV
jgi:hypothetical protein